MPQIRVRFQGSSYPDSQLMNSVQGILDKTDLFSLATVLDGKAWINTAYYCFGENLDLFFLSEPSTQHCQNIKTNSSVAATIFESHQPWGPGGKRGIQVFGDCAQAEGEDLARGVDLYVGRFPGLAQWIRTPEDFDKGIINSKLYIITPRTIKLFDEPVFGNEVFISLSIFGG
jgi:uncharacterized protein